MDVGISHLQQAAKTFLLFLRSILQSKHCQFNQSIACGFFFFVACFFKCLNVASPSSPCPSWIVGQWIRIEHLFHNMEFQFVFFVGKKHFSPVKNKYFNLMVSNGFDVKLH